MTRIAGYTGAFLNVYRQTKIKRNQKNSKTVSVHGITSTAIPKDGGSG